jgi:bacillithiol system protein YtxJ
MRSQALVDVAQLDALDRLSQEEGVLAVAIYKNSTRCSLSDVVFARLARHWGFSETELPVFVLDIIAHRALSNTVANRYQVMHESPQLLIIRHGKCVYHASHNGIAAADVEMLAFEWRS